MPASRIESRARPRPPRPPLSAPRGRRRPVPTRRAGATSSWRTRSPRPPIAASSTLAGSPPRGRVPCTASTRRRREKTPEPLATEPAQRSSPRARRTLQRSRLARYRWPPAAERSASMWRLRTVRASPLAPSSRASARRGASRSGQAEASQTRRNPGGGVTQPLIGIASALTLSPRPRPFDFLSCCSGCRAAPAPGRIGSAEGSAGRPVRRMRRVRGVAW